MKKSLHGHYKIKQQNRYL